MTATTLYRLRVRGNRAHPGNCYVMYWGDDCPSMQCGIVASAKTFTRQEAEENGQQWHDWLIANGHADAAKRVEIVPAGGGAACGWRPKHANATAV